MEQAFVSWSGGKDCCLACYRASLKGYQVRYLVNMINDDGKRSRSHGMATKWLQMQAQAMDIPLIQRRTETSSYEAEFKKAISDLKQEGITAGVFGDIDFNAHREWIDRVCSESGIKPYYPLWEENQSKLVTEFIDLGFETVVVATRADMLGEDWLGRKVDHDFLAALAKLEKITPCGEAGEYHTLVVNGPLFKKRLKIIETKKILSDGHWFFDIMKCELAPKTVRP